VARTARAEKSLSKRVKRTSEQRKNGERKTDYLNSKTKKGGIPRNQSDKKQMSFTVVGDPNKTRTATRTRSRRRAPPARDRKPQGRLSEDSIGGARFAKTKNSSPNCEEGNGPSADSRPRMGVVLRNILNREQGKLLGNRHNRHK